MTPDCYPDMPEELTDAAIAVLGTIRKRVAVAFEQLETIQESGAPPEALETLQEALADIQVSQLPTLESLFCVMFVTINDKNLVIYEPVGSETET